MFAHENIRRPYCRYPQLKLRVSERFLESCEYMPVAYVTMRCMIEHEMQLVIARFLGTGSFLIRCSNSHTK